MTGRKICHRLLWLCALGLLLGTACASPAPSPTTPAKSTPTASARPAEAPAPTAAPAKPTQAPQPSPRPTEVPPTVPAARPPEKPASKLAFDEKAVADFYRGRTLRFIVGFPAGGAFDVYSRLVAKYLPRFVPGEPTVIVENKGGAGSMLAAADVYNVQPRDGTVIASLHQNLPMQQALDRPGIEFDVRRFQWLGSAVKGNGACAARVDSGVRTIQDLLGGGSKELIVGASAPGTGTFDVPSVLNAALGTRFKLVPGYPGEAQVMLAAEAKEVEGFCGSDVRSPSWVPHLQGDRPLARVIVVLADQPTDYPPARGVPAAERLAPTQEARQLILAVNAPAQIIFPWTVAPGVPQERVAALRSAFQSIFSNPDFLAEARRSNLQEPVFSTGEEVTRVVEQLLNTPPVVIEKLKAILK